MLTDRPLFAVVFPLYDDRGVARLAIQSWLKQRTDSTPFEIVLIDSGRRRLANAVAKLLGPQDKIVPASSGNEAVLYNAGAQAATADWLVFTESHVLPAPGAIGALAARLPVARCDAAVLNSVHGATSRYSCVDGALVKREEAAMRALGLWRCVGLRGFVIRRTVFESLGGFHENYLRFAETALAIHLLEAGYRLDEFPDVVMRHIVSDSFHEVASAMALGRLGACRFHAAEHHLARAYFQCPEAALQHLSFDRGNVGHLWVEALRAALRGETGPAWRLIQLAATGSLLGGRRTQFSARLRALAECGRLLWMLYVTHGHQSVEECQPLLDQYALLRERCAEIGAIRFQQETSATNRHSSAAVPRSIAAGEFSMVGNNFFPPELWQGNTYCWSAPRAAIRIPVAPGNLEIQLDARPTGGWLIRKPRLYLNGVAIPSQQIMESEGLVTVRIHIDPVLSERGAILSWECEPFVPAKSGLCDPRKLGVALIGVRVAKVAAGSSSKLRELAA